MSPRKKVAYWCSLAVVGAVAATPALGYDWYEYNGHRYALTSTPKTWINAEAEAALAGAHLVTINDAQENIWVYQKFCVDLQQANPWIGLTDQAQEGVFRWISGEPVTYTNWSPGAPNDTPPPEDWVNMIGPQGSPPASWDDIGPASLQRGIMEVPEPASCLLLALGGLTLTTMRRRAR